MSEEEKKKEQEAKDGKDPLPPEIEKLFEDLRESIEELHRRAKRNETAK